MIVAKIQHGSNVYMLEYPMELSISSESGSLCLGYNNWKPAEASRELSSRKYSQVVFE